MCLHELLPLNVQVVFGAGIDVTLAQARCLALLSCKSTQQLLLPAQQLQTMLCDCQPSPGGVKDLHPGPELLHALFLHTELQALRFQSINYVINIDKRSVVSIPDYDTKVRLHDGLR